MEIRYSQSRRLHASQEGERPDIVDLFSQLYLASNGDLSQALEWLRWVAEQYGLTSENRTFEDILDELEGKGLISRDKGEFHLTPMGDRTVRDSVYDRVFQGLGKSLRGGHGVAQPGRGGERLPESRAYRYGDDPEEVDFGGTYRNYLHRRLGSPGNPQEEMSEGDLRGEGIQEEDFLLYEREGQYNCSTVLMIDISHSMILYGEDRITPAKIVAMSLVEYIRRHFPRDTIDVVTFGDEATEIPAREIPHISVGPYHTNTCDGLRVAQALLRRRRNPNKQIFMVTDGKPSAIFHKGSLYRNSFGLDPLVLSQTFAEARNCRKSKIRVCTFMIARDAYLIEFVEKFTRLCEGKAFYTGLDNLGDFIFVDYAANRRRRVR